MVPQINFASFAQIVADTPRQIRRADVYRLLETAKTVGALRACREWLTTERPDLTAETEECFAELA